jgi:5-methylcytosine-specific restriction endonuclease McrA
MKYLTEEHKQKIGEANKLTCTPETRERYSKMYKGKKRPEITGEKHPLFGTHMSPEHKEKLRLIQKERWASGMNNELLKNLHTSNIGCKRSAETKEKIRKAITGVPKLSQRGEKSWLWKGGISPVNHQIRQCLEYKNWRRDVYGRDNHTCIWCGKVGGRLNADHIKPFSKIMEENNIKSLEQALLCEDLWNTDNGRTLCFECHKQTDNYLRRYKKEFVGLVPSWASKFA